MILPKNISTQLNSDLSVIRFDDVFTANTAEGFYKNGGFVVKVKNGYIISYHIGQGETRLSADEWVNIGTLTLTPPSNVYSSCVISSAGAFLGSHQIMLDTNGKMYIRLSQILNYVIIDGCMVVYIP